MFSSVYTSDGVYVCLHDSAVLRGVSGSVHLLVTWLEQEEKELVGQ